MADSSSQLLNDSVDSEHMQVVVPTFTNAAHHVTLSDITNYSQPLVSNMTQHKDLVAKPTSQTPSPSHHPSSPASSLTNISSDLGPQNVNRNRPPDTSGSQHNQHSEASFHLDSFSPPPSRDSSSWRPSSGSSFSSSPFSSGPKRSRRSAFSSRQIAVSSSADSFSVHSDSHNSVPSPQSVQIPASLRSAIPTNEQTSESISDDSPVYLDRNRMKNPSFPSPSTSPRYLSERSTTSLSGSVNSLPSSRHESSQYSGTGIATSRSSLSHSGSSHVSPYEATSLFFSTSSSGSGCSWESGHDSSGESLPSRNPWSTSSEGSRSFHAPSPLPPSDPFSVSVSDISVHSPGNGTLYFSFMDSPSGQPTARADLSTNLDLNIENEVQTSPTQLSHDRESQLYSLPPYGDDRHVPAGIRTVPGFEPSSGSPPGIPDSLPGRSADSRIGSGTTIAEDSKFATIGTRSASTGLDSTSDMRQPVKGRSTKGAICNSPPSFPNATSDQKVSVRRSARNRQPQYLPLGPRHLEYDYHVAYQELRASTIRAAYSLGYKYEKPTESRTCDSQLPRSCMVDDSVKLTVEMVLAAKFPDVERASRMVNEADQKLQEALARGETWDNTPLEATCVDSPSSPLPLFLPSDTSSDTSRGPLGIRPVGGHRMASRMDISSDERVTNDKRGRNYGVSSTKGDRDRGPRPLKRKRGSSTS